MTKGGIFLDIFRSAILLTIVNLLLRFAGTSFQVFLSSRIGAAGIGLLQLTMSVGTLAMVAGMGGIRTAAMYLTAGELGRKRPRNVIRVLSGCFLYSIIFSGTVSSALYFFAPSIAEIWIGDPRVIPALRLFAAFLPCTCLCGVMTGYFTAAKRIGTLAAVEVGEQLVSMGLTLTILTLWGGQDPGRACLCVVLGSGLGACLTLSCLVILRLLEKPSAGEPFPVAGKICRTALPLAAADDLRTGITTVENLMVPKRLALHAAVENPLAAFGVLNGMVFPILMFPACILFGLAELLIPELARCHAAESRQRISYLVRRSLKIALLYGIFFSGLLILTGDVLCRKIYRNPEAGQLLRLYALLIPMLYCDAIVDAMIKGLGQQTVSVRYNILTNILDVVFLYLLLPEYGMTGYFFSFFVTHLLNFVLSLRRLLKITRERLPLHIPLLTIASGILAAKAASIPPQPPGQIVSFTLILFCLLSLFGVLRGEDFRWMRGLLRGTQKARL